MKVFASGLPIRMQYPAYSMAHMREFALIGQWNEFLNSIHSYIYSTNTVLLYTVATALKLIGGGESTHVSTRNFLGCYEAISISIAQSVTARHRYSTVPTGPHPGAECHTVLYLRK